MSASVGGPLARTTRSAPAGWNSLRLEGLELTRIRFMAAALTAVLGVTGIATSSSAAEATAEQVLAGTSVEGFTASSAREAAANVMATEMVESADPEAYVLSLSDEERQVFKAYVMLAEVEDAPGSFDEPVAVDDHEEPQRAAREATVNALTYCYTGISTRYGRNAVGGVLWWMKVQNRWCRTGSTVISSSFLASWDDTTAIGWASHGRIARDNKVVDNRGRVFAQHKFTLGSGGWIVQSRTP